MPGGLRPRTPTRDLQPLDPVFVGVNSSSSSEIPPVGSPDADRSRCPLSPDASLAPGKDRFAPCSPCSLASLTVRGSARPLPESASCVLGGARDGDGDGIPSSFAGENCGRRKEHHSHCSLAG